MRGAMLYVNAGKGHYVPAIALADSFNKAGHKAIVEDLFIAMGTPFWEWFCKYDWRFLLHHPHLEGICHYMTDNRLSTQLIKGQGLTKGHLSSLEAWYRKYKPDFVISTNFLGGIILPSAFRKLGIDIPVFQYAADVFDTPRSGVNRNITKMYLPTELGVRNAIRKGQPEDTVSLCLSAWRCIGCFRQPCQLESAARLLLLADGRPPYGKPQACRSLRASPQIPSVCAFPHG